MHYPCLELLSVFECVNTEEMRGTERTELRGIGLRGSGRGTVSVRRGNGTVRRGNVTVRHRNGTVRRGSGRHGKGTVRRGKGTICHGDGTVRRRDHDIGGKRNGDGATFRRVRWRSGKVHRGRLHRATRKTSCVGAVVVYYVIKLINSSKRLSHRGRRAAVSYR